MNKDQAKEIAKQQGDLSRAISLLASQMRMVENFMINESGSALLNSATDVICSVTESLDELADRTSQFAVDMETASAKPAR